MRENDGLIADPLFLRELDRDNIKCHIGQILELAKETFLLELLGRDGTRLLVDYAGWLVMITGKQISTLMMNR